MSRPFRLGARAFALAAASLILSAVAAGAAPLPSALGPEVPAATMSGSFVGHIKVSPTHGPVGTPVTVTADGLPANSEVQLVWRTVKGSWNVSNAEYHGRTFTPVAYQIAKVTSDAKGVATTHFVAPEDFGFTHDVIAQQGTRLLSQTGFYIDMTVDVSPKSGPVGQPIAVDVKGIGWRSLHNSWQLLYDNNYTGWISSVSTGGSAHFTIPATGKPGTHMLEVVHGGFTFPYRNMQQSPEPDRPQFAIPFTISAGDAVLPPPPPAQAQTAIRNLPAPGDLTVTPAFSPVDKPIKVSGAGFTPGKAYALNWTTVTGNRVSGGGWEESSRPIAKATADDKGNLEFALDAPDDLGGSHTLWVDDGGTKKTGTLWIQPTAFPLSVDHGPAGHALHHSPEGRRLDGDGQHLHHRLRQQLHRLFVRLQQPGRCRDPSLRHRRARLALRGPLSGDLQRQGERAQQFPPAAAHLRGRSSGRGPAALPLRLRRDGGGGQLTPPAAGLPLRGDAPAVKTSNGAALDSIKGF